MAQNDWKIGLLGGLDGTKSRSQLNSDIKGLARHLEKLKIYAELDPNQANQLKQQMKTLQIELNNVTVSDAAINGLVNSINSKLMGIQIPNITIGGTGNNTLSRQLGDNVAKLNAFKDSLKNIGMADNDIDRVAKRIEQLGVQINALGQSTLFKSGASGNREFLNVEIDGIDKFGQAVKLTEQWDLELGTLVKSIDAVSTAQEKASSRVDNFATRQKQAVSNLTNQINQLSRAANDPNAARPISETGHLTQLSDAYNDIISSIQKMGNASNATFADEQNNVRALISNYKSMVSEFRNAENVSTKMKGMDFASGLTIAKNDLEKFKAEAKDFPQILQTIQKLDTAITHVGDASSLNSFNDQLRVARSELAKFKSETNATNKSEKVGINISGLQSKISDLQKISPEINTFKTEINGAKVTVQSLLTELGKVSTQSDFSVVNTKWKAFTDAAKAAGIAVRDIGTSSDSSAKKIEAIQRSLEIGDYKTKFESIKSTFENFGFEGDKLKNEIAEVETAFNNLKNAKPDADFIALDKEFKDAFDKANNSAKQLKLNLDEIYNPTKQTKLSNDILNWLTKNTAASKEARQTLQQYYDQLQGGKVNVAALEKIQAELKTIDAQQRGLGKLGKNLKDQFKQAGESFTQWLSVSSAVMFGIQKTREAVTELKEIDNILTEISKTSDMTTAQLERLGETAFESASKYGRKASDYLTGVQEMSRSGFYGKQGEDMAEQSLLAQAAGDMDANVANKYVLATNAAYKFNGEAKKLNEVLDGQNMITNRNSVALEDMAVAMSEAGTTASSYRVSIEDLSAMIGTIESVTKLGGSEVGNAIKALLINLQNVTSSKIVDTLDAANASMTEMVDGAEKLRNPIDILKDLAKTFNDLEEDDPLRAEILTNIGQKYHATKLAALLQNMDMYDKMLGDYSEGEGSAWREAEKSANNLE